MSWDYDGWAPYVPVAQRKSQAVALAKKHAQGLGREPLPVTVSGNKIAKTFWGKAWCDHMEGLRDFSNRLPRGRTYARNGSVVDLEIRSGEIEAIVAGSSPYRVVVSISTLAKKRWGQLRAECSQSVESMLDLLAGRFADGVMRQLTGAGGLLPTPAEIRFRCSCPDYAVMCKHVAAVMYGIGARLDHAPELLFVLRNVDPTELVGEAVTAKNLDTAFGESDASLAGEDLGAMFGIELDAGSPLKAKPRTVRGTRSKSTTRKKAKSSPKSKTSANSKSAQPTTTKRTAKKSASGKTAGKIPAKSKASSKTVPRRAKPSVAKAEAATETISATTKRKRSAKKKASRRKTESSANVGEAKGPKTRAKDRSSRKAK
ncbi:MAG: SWIM zinc finger family protein [Planctomycetales bacterium]|nr:SWIM zinc finger family protein [Planctomycetales bacterium]